MVARLSRALDELRAASAAMTDRYAGDCLKHAKRIAALLAEEGRDAWIGRVRHEVPFGDSFYRHPLLPRRFPGTVWETHYVACSGREAWDPIVGAPVGLDAYTTEVFGVALPVERVTDPDVPRRAPAPPRG